VVTTRCTRVPGQSGVSLNRSVRWRFLRLSTDVQTF